MLTELSGRRIAGRYDLLALLGSGGMGAVYRAHDCELDETVALKVMKSSIAREPAFLARFRQEVKIARRVTHRNVARTYELGHDQELVFCTMELVTGRSLRERLERTGALRVSEAVGVACALCEALVAAHEVGVIHRDIKPDNILLGDDGRVVLADFGIATLAGELFNLGGTPPYMAPEQNRGEPPTTAVDIYAVAVVLYEMLTGQRAFTGSSEKIRADKERMPHLPARDDLERDLAAIVEWGTARNPLDRIASAAELLRMLAPWSARISRPLGVASTNDSTVPPQFEMRTIILLPPRGDDRSLHIAGGVHEELLARLAALPRVRLQPRTSVTADDQPTLVVSLRAAEELEVHIARPDGREIVVWLPLAIDQVETAAAAGAAAIVNALDATSALAPSDAEALELFLQARQVSRLNIHDTATSRVLGFLERASSLRPDDPKISAGLAIATLRHALFAGHIDDGGTTLLRAAALVNRAVANGPQVADSHLAAAQLALSTRGAAPAARHFRRAIACAPYFAEAHEFLGRMLLEAGFGELGEARIDDALAIAPELTSGRWDRARAWHLDGRNADAWREAKYLTAVGSLRHLLLLRMSWWERNLVRSAEIREELTRSETYFDPIMQPLLLASIHDGGWVNHREALLSYALAPTPNLRRACLLAQLVAEVAGFVGDADTAMDMVLHAVRAQLFDRHWLERCPLLEEARTYRAYLGARDVVRERADHVLDALYGDGETDGPDEVPGHAAATEV